MSDINNRIVWLNGALVNVNDAKINVLAPTAQFGANVFEGIRCYWNEEKQQLYAFRLDDHYNRLLNSMKMFRMEMKYTKEDFTKALIDVIKANNYKEDIAIRQTVFLDGFGSWFAEGPIGMFVAPIPKGRTLPESKNGYTACISSWERISDRNLSPRVKVGANYINSRLGQLEALRNGYDTCIFLNELGKVSEGPGSCLFIVKNGILVTPLLTDSVLESITRDTVLKISQEININTDVRSIDRTELYTCDEAFLCGSAMEITPIISVDRYKITDDEGEITSKIHELYLEIVSGNNSNFIEWITPIY